MANNIPKVMSVVRSQQLMEDFIRLRSLALWLVFVMLLGQ